jgi:sugar lactone lactonase YvrE
MVKTAMKNIFLTIVITGSVMAQNKDPKLEEVAEFGKNQPIGVAVQTTTNRLFVSFPHNEPFLYAVTEIKDGKRIPYPNEEWNKQGKDAQHFNNAQDMYADDEGYLWVLDSKPAGNASVFGDGGKEKLGEFKLIQFDLKTNTEKKVYFFGGLPKDKSGLNDIRIDTDKQLAYLSDPGLKAIVVLDLKTDTVRVVLQSDASTVITPGYNLKIDGVEMIDDKGKPFSSNVNGIALTKNNKYFYYKPINHDQLYRIETKYLADSALSATALSSKVEKVANTGITHGLECDAKGNIYYGDSPNHSINYVSPNGRVHTLVKDDRLIWPDSFGIGSDGYLYVSCAQINRQPKYNKGKSRVEFPYRVFRVKMPE